MSSHLITKTFMARISTKKDKAPRKLTKTAAEAPAAETALTEPPPPAPVPVESENTPERTMDSITAAASEDARKDNAMFLPPESSGQLRPPSAPVEPTGEEPRQFERRGATASPRP